MSLLFQYAAPLIFLLLFFAAYKINRTRLLSGFLFTCSLLSCMGIVFLQAYHSGSPAAKWTLVVLFILFLFIAAFGVYIFILFLIFNTARILKKERRSLKHCLTLVLAAGLLVFAVLPRFLKENALPAFLIPFMYSLYGLIFYYLFHLTQYIITTILCNLSHPGKDQDYIIVPGAWIKDGKVAPLLARRIDRAIEFYRRQEKTGRPPKLLLSGGKGPDETCTEAEAMGAYALEKGIPGKNLLLETQAASTLENMRFSKELMDRESGAKPYKCIYATNNYHLLRAGVLCGFPVVLRLFPPL
jgi:uncharacterized SAM-binding protein YcdF (DUF218 family)